MSKSRGLMLIYYLLAERYSRRCLRYFLLRDFPFRSDLLNELLINRIVWIGQRPRQPAGTPPPWRTNYLAAGCPRRAIKLRNHACWMRPGRCLLKATWDHRLQNAPGQCVWSSTTPASISTPRHRGVAKSESVPVPCVLAWYELDAAHLPRLRRSYPP